MYFCDRHKNRQKYNQHFKLLLFRINFVFFTSNWMSTYGKLNLLLINSIYLVFFSLEIQRRLMQIEIYYSFFSSAWKETSLKPLQVAPAKILFPSVYVIGTTCFDEYFLIRLIIEWQYFIYRFIVTQRFFATTMLLRSLKQMFWKCYVLCLLSPQ